MAQYEEAIADFQRMRQLARTSGDQRQEGESLFCLASVHHLKTTDKHRLLEEQCAQEAVQLAQQTGDQKILAMSLDALGRVHQVRGDLQEAERQLRLSLRISQREGYTDTFASLLRSLGMQAYWQGHFQRTLHLGQEWVTLSRAIHDGSLELTGLSFLCLTCWSFGTYAQARCILHEGMTKAQERESMMVIGRLTNTLGWFHREFGDLSSAVEYDHESMELGRAHHLANVEVRALINLGLDYGPPHRNTLPSDGHCVARS